MAVKWNKIYRGGVQRTTPETHEANAPATGNLLPGTAVTLNAATNTFQTAAAGSAFFYLVGEQLHGNVDEDQVGLESSVRGYTPRSGDLYAGRLAAGVAIANDLALTINADGRFAAAAGEDVINAYIDDPASDHPQTTPTTSTLDQLVPIKIK